ncbi:MAG: DNA-processing protein DprA [Deltaproteobacteria bacterium]|nr:DNA-processing protein DprA [Deltaproteobacteria bacterium]
MKPWEWLALQRLYHKKPQEGHRVLRSGLFPFTKTVLEQAKKDFSSVEKNGFQIIPYDHPSYPSLLKEIFDPPLVLLAKGEVLKWDARPWVAVVGSRKASRWGVEKTKEIVASFVKEGFGIISGLAYGIDAAAHEATLQTGGVTWGVLGSSLDRLYPSRHSQLASRMEKNGGGILSEFPFGTGPNPGNFPQRNRIISGISVAVVIIEAALKSGSLITARYALEQGREVFVAEPPNRSVQYDGNWKWLEDGAESLKRKILPLRQAQGQDDVLQYLSTPRTLDFLAAKTNKEPQFLLAELAQLETEGFISRLPGALWQSR